MLVISSAERTGGLRKYNRALVMECKFPVLAFLSDYSIIPVFIMRIQNTPIFAKLDRSVLVRPCPGHRKEQPQRRARERLGNHHTCQPQRRLLSVCVSPQPCEERGGASLLKRRAK